MIEGAVLVTRQIVNEWRDTTYRRPDGSTFRIGLPRVLSFCEDGSYSTSYDEDAEAKGVTRFMAGR